MNYSLLFQMSLGEDSPVHSSGSEEFAAFLDGHLAESFSGSSSEEDSGESDDDDGNTRYQPNRLFTCDIN